MTCSLVRLSAFAGLIFFLSTTLYAEEATPKKLADYAATRTVAQSLSEPKKSRYEEGFVKGFRSALLNNSPYLTSSNGDKFWETGFKDGRDAGLGNRPEALKNLTLKDFGFDKIPPTEGFIY